MQQDYHPPPSLPPLTRRQAPGLALARGDVCRRADRLAACRRCTQSKKPAAHPRSPRWQHETAKNGTVNSRQRHTCPSLDEPEQAPAQRAARAARAARALWAQRAAGAARARRAARAARARKVAWARRADRAPTPRGARVPRAARAARAALAPTPRAGPRGPQGAQGPSGP